MTPPKTRAQVFLELRQDHARSWYNWPRTFVQGDYTNQGSRFFQWRREWWDLLWEHFPKEMQSSGAFRTPPSRSFDGIPPSN